MNMATKHDVLQAHLKEWLAAKGNRKHRGVLTTKLAEMLHMHKKAIPRSMWRLQLHDKSVPERRGRPVTYGADVRAAFCTLWETMDYPCAEHMTRSAIDTYISAGMNDGTWSFPNDVIDKLLVMSTGKKKIFIRAFRIKRSMLRGRSATVSSPLKGMIPIRKSHTWVDLPPGYLQTDSVVHCGDLLSGDLVYSVGCVDFATYWSEYAAQWNKGREATKESLSMIRGRFPFIWREIHPDTGNEFINYLVHQWATAEGIAMTRSEPYKKNDNMCIEERNGSIVRKHLGCIRMDDQVLVPLASEILRVACLIHNHFRPVRRMLTKVRIGAKWKRTFEKRAKTPFERVMERSDVSLLAKEELQRIHNALNPLELKRTLDMLKSTLGKKLDDLSAKKRASR